MADKKRKPGNNNSVNRSRNAEIAKELAHELGVHDAPDSPTGQAFVASIAATQPDTEISGPSPADMEASAAPGPSSADLEAAAEPGSTSDDAEMALAGFPPETASNSATEAAYATEASLGLASTTQPIEEDSWATADQEAMNALDKDIFASYSNDMEASMEEDIRGAAEGISRRNPQMDQQDVAQQTSDSANSTNQPNSADATETATNTAYSGVTQGYSTDSSSYIRPAVRRRAADEEVASFFRFSGGPFPSLFQSGLADKAEKPAADQTSTDNTAANNEIVEEDTTDVTD